MPKLFVYGTLKRGYRNHRLLNDADFLYNGEVNGYDLLHLGEFPGMIPGKGIVHGEYFLVDEKDIPALDRLEGHPDFFRRVEINYGNDEVPFSVYIFQPMRNIPEYRIIKSGRWEE